MVTTTKNKFVTKNLGQLIPDKIEEQEVINVDTSISSEKPNKSNTLSSISNKSCDTRPPTDPEKEEISFTDLLSKDLDVSLEEGELSGKTNPPDNDDHLKIQRPRTSTPIPTDKDETQKSSKNSLVFPENNKKEDLINSKYIPEPTHDYPSYDPLMSKCQKYVPTSEILFDLYTMVRKANQNVGMAMRQAMINEKLLITKNSK